MLTLHVHTTRPAFKVPIHMGHKPHWKSVTHYVLTLDTECRRWTYFA